MLREKSSSVKNNGCSIVSCSTNRGRKDGEYCLLHIQDPSPLPTTTPTLTPTPNIHSTPEPHTHLYTHTNIPTHLYTHFHAYGGHSIGVCAVFLAGRGWGCLVLNGLIWANLELRLFTLGFFIFSSVMTCEVDTVPTQENTCVSVWHTIELR